MEPNHLQSIKFLIDSRAKFTDITNFKLSGLVKQLGGSLSYTINKQVDYVITNDTSLPEYLKTNSKVLSQCSNTKFLNVAYFCQFNDKSTTIAPIENFVFDQKEFSVDETKKKTKNDDEAHQIRHEIKNNPRYIATNVYELKDRQPSFPDEYMVLIKRLLTCTYLGYNTNKFYYIELQQATDLNLTKHFRIYTEFGRTDQVDRSNAQHRYPDCYDDAINIFSSIYSQKLEDNSGYQIAEMTHTNIGSKKKYEFLKTGKFPQDESNSTGTAGSKYQIENQDFQNSYIEKSVASLISTIYQEASKCLLKNFSVKITNRGIETPLGALSMDQLNAASTVLNDISKEINSTNNNDTLVTLTSKFFQYVPSKLTVRNKSIKNNASVVISTNDNVIQYVELLDMMKDLTRVYLKNENNQESKNELDMQYSALNTEIHHLSSASSEYGMVINLLKKNPRDADALSDGRIKISNIYRLIKDSEEKQFKDDIGNVQYLFHGSKIQNFVGLLSKGILMPNVVVSKGGSRSDFGFLGTGIYFNTDIKSSLYYASASSGANGVRMILMSQVALGSVKEYSKINSTLTSPPTNFHSCKGVSVSSCPGSDFRHDEHVIYDPTQTKLSYLIEFTA
ncbi:hypothetical protein CYY_000866 [Polysphondylium violaceum]|uniref:Poly [ADP-ribose] polymerase n=1 Tax=Polysphondylium violaceum TaxID=133409 RepID=A0A8J4UWR8_9MYCE|nr:hypothetical protein CYY_000866 [Polysphondylium violaceum]